MTKKELLAYGKRIGATIKMKNTKAEMIAIIKAAEK
jgi:K+/H+ antiporter YhaU regulatory subunit KhtT